MQGGLDLSLFVGSEAGGQICEPGVAGAEAVVNHLVTFLGQRAQALHAQRAALNPLQLRRAIYAGLEHLFAYPNAQPDQVQDIFQTLADPDLFPEAVAALRAVETVDKPKSGLTTVPTAPTTTAVVSSLSSKEEAMLQ